LGPIAVAVILLGSGSGCARQVEALKTLITGNNRPARRQRVELRAYSIVVPRIEAPLLLHGVARLTDSGMERDALTAIQQKLDRLEVGDVNSHRLSVSCDGEPMELEIQMFLDHEGEPELFFFAPEPLHRRIAEHGDEVKAMLREQQRDVTPRHLVVEAE
jgi:hypothetical protein